MYVSLSIAETSCETPMSQSEDVSEDSRRNEERAECSAEDRREETVGETVTQQSVEISEHETIEIENEESEKKCGDGKVGLL